MSIFIDELVDFYENDEEGRHEETGDVLILHEICKCQMIFYSDGSRISHRRDIHLLFSKNFHKNCIKMKRVWSNQGGAGRGRASEISLCRSATILLSKVFELMHGKYTDFNTATSDISCNSLQSKNSADCQSVFGTSSTSNSQSNTGNPQSGGIWPFNDNVGSPSSSSGSSSLPFPFNVNVGAQAPSSTSAGYDQYRSMLDTSAFNSGGSYSLAGPYPGS